MKKLGKRLQTTCETVEAFACICLCGPCSCGCNPILATHNYYQADDDRYNSTDSSGY